MSGLDDLFDPFNPDPEPLGSYPIPLFEEFSLPPSRPEEAISPAASKKPRTSDEPLESEASPPPKDIHYLLSLSRQDFPAIAKRPIEQKAIIDLLEAASCPLDQKKQLVLKLISIKKQDWLAPFIPTLFRCFTSFPHKSRKEIIFKTIVCQSGRLIGEFNAEILSCFAALTAGEERDRFLDCVLSSQNPKLIQQLTDPIKQYVNRVFTAFTLPLAAKTGAVEAFEKLLSRLLSSQNGPLISAFQAEIQDFFQYLQTHIPRKTATEALFIRKLIHSRALNLLEPLRSTVFLPYALYAKNQPLLYKQFKADSFIPLILQKEKHHAFFIKLFNQVDATQKTPPKSSSRGAVVFKSAGTKTKAMHYSLTSMAEAHGKT